MVRSWKEFERPINYSRASNIYKSISSRSIHPSTFGQIMNGEILNARCPRAVYARAKKSGSDTRGINLLGSTDAFYEAKNREAVESHLARLTRWKFPFLQGYNESLKILFDPRAYIYISLDEILNFIYIFYRL